MTIHSAEALDTFTIFILNKRILNILQNIIENKKSTSREKICQKFNKCVY